MDIKNSPVYLMKPQNRFNVIRNWFEYRGRNRVEERFKNRGVTRRLGSIYLACLTNTATLVSPAPRCRTMWWWVDVYDGMNHWRWWQRRYSVHARTHARVSIGNLTPLGQYGARRQKMVRPKGARAQCALQIYRRRLPTTFQYSINARGIPLSDSFFHINSNKWPP